MEILMRAAQMQQAAKSIAGVLASADILDIIRQCRTADSQGKAASLVKLGHAGAMLMESTEKLDAHAKQVLKHLHLDALTTPGYWRNLLDESTAEPTRQAELVRLYSRVLFASSHLPSLLSLVSTVSDVQQPQAGEGEQVLTIKLTDAGEKASDPDRLARAIDGIDMLYSACATLAKKPAMDLQLLSIHGQADRDISFLGDIEAIQAVKTVVESIPDAIAHINPDEEVDIQALVRSLPIFDDLKVLQKLGTYTPSDLKDIKDTMHQGVLLSLESGVVMVYDDEQDEEPGATQRSTTAPSTAEPATGHPASAEGEGRHRSVPTLHVANKPSSQAIPQANSQANPQKPAPGSNGSLSNAEAADAKAKKDTYYDHYLQERERLQSGAEPVENPLADPPDQRASAINNLLRGLKK